MSTTKGHEARPRVASRASIYEFQDYLTYLQFVRKHVLAKRQRPITLEKWAARLGYRSPRSMAMILKGQRLPSDSMISQLSSDLGLGRKEKHYLWLLIRLEKLKKRKADLREIYEQLEEANPRIPKTAIDAQVFSYVAEWQHLVLKNLLSLDKAAGTPAVIARRLRNKLSESQVQKALTTLKNLGLIKEEGGQLKPADSGVITTSDIPSRAIQLHHEQMLARACEALAEQEVLEREITSVTLGFDRRRMQEAKEMIRRFRDAFDKKFTTKETDQVYQLNIQFFAHTLKTEGGTE